MEPQDGIEIISLTFRHSAQLDQIFDALSKAQAEMDAAKKDATNPHFRSKYADLASVMDACRPSLSKYGIAIIQPVSAIGPKTTVTTVLGHKSGQWMASDLEMTSAQNTPQGIGSTITYGRRYGLQSMAGIASDDDDGNAGSMAGSREAQKQVLAQKMAEIPPQEPPKRTTKKQTDDPENWKPNFVESMRVMKSELGAGEYYRLMGLAGYADAQELATAGRQQAHDVYLVLAAALKEKKLQVSEADIPEPVGR